MPRLPHTLLLKAHKISSLLPLILRTTRTLDSAINELRWLKEHISSTSKNKSPAAQRRKLRELCIKRSRAWPLQYLLGSQPFGELDIRCRPGVLIPRPETEAYTTHAANLLLGNELEKFFLGTRNLAKGRNEDKDDFVAPLRILDACSGSGCISLLLHSLLSKKFKNLSVIGLDISEKAVALANKNLELNVKSRNLSASANSIIGTSQPQVQFRICDILNQDPRLEPLDIIISNPPYISSKKFTTETSRSVRNYEPKLALVPPLPSNTDVRSRDLFCAPEDVFYRRLYDLHSMYGSKMLVMEVGDEEQAKRVVRMAIANKDITKSNTIEVWRDWPDQPSQAGEDTVLRIEKQCIHPENPNLSGEIPAKEVPVRGTGSVRTVVLYRKKCSRPGEEG